MGAKPTGADGDDHGDDKDDDDVITLAIIPVIYSQWPRQRLKKAFRWVKKTKTTKK